MAAMTQAWELLTLRGLAATDERAEEFTGTLVIHREGSPEPVESGGQGLRTCERTRWTSR